MEGFQLRNEKPKSITIFKGTRLTYLTKRLKSLKQKWTNMNRFLLEIKYKYEWLDPLLPAMPFMDALNVSFVLMIFHTTWFLTKKRMLLLEKSRWLTSMGLTELPGWASLWRLPGRERNGQGRWLEPHLAGRLPSPCRSTCGFSYSRPHRSGDQGLEMKTVPLIMKPDATEGLPWWSSG